MTHSLLTTRAKPVCHPMDCHVLRVENQVYRGTGGRSQENGAAGFVPAFRDDLTGATYRSRFADGRPAPIHLLEGLPAGLLSRTAERGGVIPTGCHLVSGFLRGGRFYTRAEAAAVRQRELR